MDDDYSELSHTIFNEYILQSNDKWYINAGIRSTYFIEGDHLSFEPRVKLEYAFNEQLRFRSTAEYKKQNISQIIEFETSDFGLENQLWTLSDGEDIPYIISKQISSGLLYTKNNWVIDLDAYHKIIENINTFTKGFDVDATSVSIGKKTITGLDCLVKKHIKKLNLSASYSLMNAKLLFSDLNDGKHFPDNFDIRHKLYLSSHVALNSFNFALSWKFHSGKPYTLFKISDNNNSTILDYKLNTSHLPNYHRLDASANYTIRFKKKQHHQLRFSFALQNIYNRNNILDRTHNIFEDTDGSITETIKIDQKSIGFTPNLSVRYWF